MKSKEAVARIKKIGRCENPRCSNKDKNPVLHVHHIKTRGSGGGDVEDNLALLCVFCHNLAHSGQISHVELYAMIKNRKKSK